MCCVVFTAGSFVQLEVFEGEYSSGFGVSLSLQDDGRAVAIGEDDQSRAYLYVEGGCENVCLGVRVPVYALVSLV